eukprot:jgi/Bigna1/145522/aug1.100_g20230
MDGHNISLGQTQSIMEEMGASEVPEKGGTDENELMEKVSAMTRNPDPNLASVMGRKRRGKVVEFLSSIFGLDSTTMIIVLKNLAVNLLVAWNHSRQITNYYNANTVLDELVSKIAELEEQYDSDLETINRNGVRRPRRSRPYALLQFLKKFILRRRSKAQEQILESARMLEYRKKQERYQMQAFIYVTSRIVAAIGQHLWRSILQHGGVYQALRSSPLERPEDIARGERLDIEGRVADLERQIHDVELRVAKNQALGEKRDDINNEDAKSPPNENVGAVEAPVTKSKDQDIDRLSRLRHKHSIFSTVLKMEIIKLRISSLAQYFDRIISTEWNKYISSMVNIIVNLISSAYATYDSKKLALVVKNPNLRLPKLHRYIPHYLYSWITVSSYRWIPTYIHLTACYINFKTCITAKTTRISLKREVEHLRELEIRFRAASKRFLKVMSENE